MIQHSEQSPKADDTPIANVPSPCSSTCTSEEASSSMSDYHYPPDVKVGIEELCPVCGDKVSGYHYGLLTCESCKGFFKRTVQNKKVYSCVDNQGCQIDKAQRKRCPYCRFQKCLQVGMKLEAVRSDRMRGGRNKFGPMYKRDRALKQQALRQRQQLLAQCQMQLGGMAGMQGMDPQQQDIKPNLAMLFPNMPPQGQVAHHHHHHNQHHQQQHQQQQQQGLGPPRAMMAPVHSSTQENHITSSPPQAPPPMSVNASQGNYLPPQQAHTYPHPQSHPHSTHHTAAMMHSSGIGHQMALPALPPPPRVVPQLIKDLQTNEPDQGQMRQKIQGLLAHFMTEQPMTDRGPLYVLRMLCKLADQCLFQIVEWARATVFFKDLKVEDQMKLLQNCWSELLVVDFLFRSVSNSNDEFTLINGQKISLECMDMIGAGEMRERVLDLMKKFRELRLDHNEHTCLRYLILLNPDILGLQDRGYVEQSQEKINAALMQYTTTFYPEIKDKFGQILLRLPEIRLISIRGEEFLYFKHLSGEIPEQTLLMEMLHSKRK